MSKGLKIIVLVLGCCIAIIGCAKRGSITGGEKDITPPKFIKANPPNFSTNFDKKEIRIYFDEYIKLEEAQKQIIISPPMDPKPTITPLGGASKYVKIEFLDTLLENTTYSINFGESVVDNNESNPLPFFRYVFSTGNYLDSLSIKGTVTDALNKVPDSYITVALYEVNDTFNDSTIYKEVPRYITSTLDTVGFELNNLKSGSYKLIALKDASLNYKYEPKQDKIGFYEKTVELPADTATFFEFPLFKENLEFRAIKPKQTSKNSFDFGYEGVRDSMQIKILSATPENFETRVFPEKEKDTLQYWFKPFFEADSLVFEVTNGNYYKDTLVARFKDQYKDSLMISPVDRGTLPLNKKLRLSANTPLVRINDSLISLTDKDTVAVSFNTKIDTIANEAIIDFEKTESNAYTLELRPEAILDFVENKSDSLSFTFRTKKMADYGKVFLTLQNIKKYPVIAQLTNEKGEVLSERMVKEEKVIVFDYLDPAKYNLRVILDENANGQWDTGSYLKKLLPEKVTYYPDVIEVRANWDLKQTFILKE
ncbi:Ig-like domain-containing protein [Aquimarina brevivitae]|uniref:Ig-like domain-containing protein n=1 Tax=Aquimarina brevivitae TaxID=323412 RepID=A0A4Q7PFZ3_9FLAO|nr:Ig-like domain-containing protein [Aquimarina brevivitae]RZS99401.1 Ig-like domain-containing protein [Aquimarina brevivitae]